MTDKWNGVERLAEVLFKAAHLVGRHKVEELMAERLVPLLLALYAETCSVDDCGHGNCDEIRRLLATWR